MQCKSLLELKKGLHVLQKNEYIILWLVKLFRHIAILPFVDFSIITVRNGFNFSVIILWIGISLGGPFEFLTIMELNLLKEELVESFSS